MDIRFLQAEEVNSSLIEYKIVLDNTGNGKISFKGDCGYGSKGNNDGEFMSEIMKLLLQRSDVKNMIVDLRELNYEWGNYISKMLFRLYDSEIPIGIIYSEKCKAILPSNHEMFFRTEREVEKYLNIK